MVHERLREKACTILIAIMSVMHALCKVFFNNVDAHAKYSMTATDVSTSSHLTSDISRYQTIHICHFLRMNNVNSPGSKRPVIFSKSLAMVLQDTHG